MQLNTGKILRIVLRVLLGVLSFILVILLVAFLLIRTEKGQNIIRKKAVTYLSNKIGAQVSIGSLKFDLLNHIEINGITIPDQSKQVLLHVGRFEGNYHLLDLLNNKISVSKILIDTLDFRMVRAENDSAFNFDFIIRAFASPPSTQPIDTTPGKSFSFNIGELTVRQLHFVMDDKKGRQFHDVKSNLISINVDKLDLQNQDYAIKSFDTEGLTAKLDIGSSGSESSETSEGALPKISIGKIALLNNNFSVLMPGSGYQSESNIRDFNAKNLAIDLNKNLVELKEILIGQHQSKILIQTVQTKPTIGKDKVIGTTKTVPFTVNIGSIKLTDNDLKYDQGTTTFKASTDFNPKHIHLERLQLAIADFSMAGSEIQGEVQQFQAKEQSGLEIRQINGGFIYSDTGVNLLQLVLKTPYTTIDGNFMANYTSIEDISKNPGQLGFDINAKQIMISSKDMRHFSKMAGSNTDIHNLMANDIYLEGRAVGKVADMTFEKLKLKTRDITFFTSGKMAGLPDPNQLLAAINLHEFSGTVKSLSELLPQGIIPPTIAANESFNFNGKLGGNKGTYNFDLEMNSSAGNLVIDGKVIQLKSADKLSYNVHAQSDELQLNKILMDTLYGNTVFDIQVNGKGISTETADAKLKASIPGVYFKGYYYKNIDLNAIIAASIIDANLIIRDSACNTELFARYSLDSLHPLLQASADIKNIDLRRLRFTKDSLQLKAVITADLTNADAKHINGTILIPNMKVTYGKHVFPFDTISLNAVNIDSAQLISFRSPFLDVDLDGAYELNVLPEVAQNLLVDYFKVNPPNRTVFKPAHAELKGELRYNPIFQAFVPGLTSMKNINFSGDMDTRKKEMNIVLNAPEVIYSDYILDSTSFIIKTIHDTLNYRLYSAGVKSPSLTLNRAIISGNAKEGIINWNIKLHNKPDLLQYDLTGMVTNDSTKTLLQFAAIQLINFDKWTANADNRTEYSKKRMYSNLELSSGSKKLVLQSSKSENGLPTNLQLFDFPISTITKIIGSDSTLAEGTINGEASLINLDPLRFSANFIVDSLTAMSVKLGTLDAKVSNEPGIGYKGEIKLNGTDNELGLNATYSEEGAMNGRLNIIKFNVQALNPFLKSIIRGLGGSVDGNVAITGTIAKPVLNGELNIHNIRGSYREYNTFFKIPEEKILFTGNGIALNNFVINDSLDNTANVNGLIRTTDYRNYNYDLKIKTDHFMAMNTKTFPEQEIYGPAFITSDLSITSAGNTLMVKGDVRVDEKSVMNVEMNNLDTTVANNSGIIVYVNSLQSADSVIFHTVKTELSKNAVSAQVGLAINLEMTKTSKLNIYLDKSGGDFMKVAGDANLTITQSPGGQMIMQGKFTIDNGEYQMTISQVIKRKFKVQSGSSISWNGSPTDADIDLTALYNVQTTAEPILTGSQTINKGAFKQVLPFEVYLFLKNKLLQPAISFKLEMPAKERNAFDGVVYARIKQINQNESELNKQVMGLLILNQFVPADPLSPVSESGTLFDYETAARNTAGSIISSQLNSLIASKIKSVNLDFVVDSKADYTTGEKTNTTDLTVNMSKSLFNDRTTVSVGSTFALEGSDQHKQSTSGLAGNFIVEYKLTADGRYRAKVYRRDQYETDNSGQVVQTGVSFVVFFDFNKYRDIFKKTKEPGLK